MIAKAPRKSTAFDYKELPAEHRKSVRDAAKEISRLNSESVSAAVRIGKELLRVRECFPPHSRPWVAWLRNEFQWSQSVASRLMSIAEKFGDSPNIDRFHISALSALVRKATPAAAVREAFRMASQGKLVSRKTAIQLIGRHQKSGDSLAKQEAILRLRHAIRKLSKECGAAFPAELAKVIGAQSLAAAMSIALQAEHST